MRILITGGSGFIGVAIAETLLEQGHEVTCLDVVPGYRLDSLEKHPGFRLVIGDVQDATLVDSLVSAADFVFHLGAVVGVDEYIQRPLDVLDVNILGTRLVLSACRKYDRPVIFASSSETYGKATGLLKEDGDHLFGDLANSRWSYALTKAVGEQYAVALGRQGLRYAIVRFFNVYGPLMDHPGMGRVISKFLGYIRDGRPLPLVDGGYAVRCYCYIDDAVDATLRIFGALCEGNHRVAKQAFNIGKPDPVPVRELADLMIALSGHVHGTVDVPGKSFFGEGFEEIPYRVPDVSAMREILGFEAKTELVDGLARVLGYWKLLAADMEDVSRRNALVAPRLDRVPFVRPCLEVNPDLLDRISGALSSGRVTNSGSLTTRFEMELADWLGRPRSVVVSSGSFALLLGLRALELGPGCVVLPSFTYLSTLSAVVNAGFTPVFCDIDPGRWTMSPDHLERIFASVKDVRAVIPVNVYGVPPDLERIAGLCRARGAAVVYDNAHGFGTVVDGVQVSPLVDVMTCSLHATKVLPAVEGGLVVCRDDRVLERVRSLANHGFSGDPLDSGFGFNAKMSELHAAVGLNALAGLPDALARRRVYVARLQAAVAAEGDAVYGVQQVPDGVVTNNQNLAVLCRFANKVGIEAVTQAFASHGIEARRYFWPPLHHLRMYEGRFSLPVTDQVSAQLVCLPLYSRMDESTIARVEQAIHLTARDFS